MMRPYPEYHLFQLLRRFENQHLPLDLFLSHYFRAHRALGSKDRQTICKAAYGMMRWRSLLDHLIEGHPSWEKRHALYQNFQPHNYLKVNTIPLHIRLALPQPLVQILLKDYGEEACVRLAQVMGSEAPITVRVNPLKASREELLEMWQEEFAVTPGALSPYAIHFKKRAPLTALPAFREGLFEIQDESSQHVANLVALKPGDHVLDYCAGAGGKTLAYAHKSEGKGQLYLHDIRPLILERAKKRLKRAGIQNAQIVPNLSHLRSKMDWVLVDAPCTGTGTYRRNPDQKWKFSKQQLMRIVKEQREIFAQALRFLKRDGKIVYATCSLLKAENERQVEHFLKEHSLILAQEPFKSTPDFGEGDGFFAAVFHRSSNA